MKKLLTHEQAASLRFMCSLYGVNRNFRHAFGESVDVDFMVAVLSGMLDSSEVWLDEDHQKFALRLARAGAKFFGWECWRQFQDVDVDGVLPSYPSVDAVYGGYADVIAGDMNELRKAFASSVKGVVAHV